MPTDTQATRKDDLTDFLSRTAAKERAKIEKHLATVDAHDDGVHGKLWRRLALMLDALSGAGVESSSGQAWRFFIPDGKYRMQVFALEDRGDGMLRIVLPDVLEQAVARKIIGKTKVPGEYTVPSSREVLHIEAIDPSKTQDPPAHVKSMLGWGRRAIQITISTVGDNKPLEAAQKMCEMAAKQFVKA
ncbi:MAG TPA: hypothetical protein VF669_03295 [Tepidisphaeraceae bacterium]|jgi:hypothetical protein